jgi:hypothetical protein
MFDRKPYPIPREALSLLASIPKEFRDDGCSNALDSWFGFDFAWACRIHDWRYCTRCHQAGSMDYACKVRDDRELQAFVACCLPWRWKWLGRVYKRAVLIAGGWNAYDSCGPEKGALCRHGMPMPRWMREGIGLR